MSELPPLRRMDDRCRTVERTDAMNAIVCYRDDGFKSGPARLCGVRLRTASTDP
jgi:hypothetical protein